jgi:hypothetical protein
MGIKQFFHDLETKVSPSRLFKALSTESHNVLPKCSQSIKSIEFVEGNGVNAGCIIKTTLADGDKYVTHSIDAIDHENYVCSYTLIKGDVIGDKVEKVCYEMKLEATEDGGCVIKVESEYHIKGDDVELNEDEVKASQEQALGLYKACEKYLIDHPEVCA